MTVPAFPKANSNLRVRALLSRGGLGNRDTGGSRTWIAVARSALHAHGGDVK